MERLAPVAALTALMLGVAACGGSAAHGGRSSARSSAPALASESKAGVCLPHGSTTKRESGRGLGVELIVSAEVLPIGCTDLVRFVFSSTKADLPPRYTAVYESGPFVDFNEGSQIKVAGSAFLVVTFHTVGSTLFSGKTTFRSRESITPSSMHHLREVRMVAAPPDSVQFVVGLDSPRPFVVDGAPAPPQVTVTVG